MGARVAAAVAAALAEVSAAGHAAIADAVHWDPARRAEIAAAARAPFHGFMLAAPMAELEARVAGRHGDASDADIAVLRRMAQNDAGPCDWRWVDAGTGSNATDAIRAWLGS
jgi:predicted kinase